jgi:hypothetical protein
MKMKMEMKMKMKILMMGIQIILMIQMKDHMMKIMMIIIGICNKVKFYGLLIQKMGKGIMDKSNN